MGKKADGIVYAKGWGDCVDEVLRIKTPKQGAAYVKSELRRLRGTRKDWARLSYAEAKRLWLSNMGYMSGYYGPREANHIMRVLGAAHLIFGAKR